MLSSSAVLRVLVQLDWQQLAMQTGEPGYSSWRQHAHGSSAFAELLSACETRVTDDESLSRLESSLCRLRSRPGGVLAFTLDDILQATVAAVSHTWLNDTAVAGSRWVAVTVQALHLLTLAASKQHNARKARPILSRAT